MIKHSTVVFPSSKSYFKRWGQLKFTFARGKWISIFFPALVFLGFVTDIAVEYNKKEVPVQQLLC